MRVVAGVINSAPCQVGGKRTGCRRRGLEAEEPHPVVKSPRPAKRRKAKVTDRLDGIAPSPMPVEVATEPPRPAKKHKANLA